MVKKFLLILFVILLQSCMSHVQGEKKELHDGIFTESVMDDKIKEKFYQFLEITRKSIDDSIGTKDGLYLFDVSACDVCSIEYIVYYFNYSDNTIEYCFKKNNEKKCSQFMGHSDIIKRVLNIDYENYPLIVADWGMYQTDFQHRHVYALNKFDRNESVNLFYQLNRCFKTHCEAKVDYMYVPSKYKTNVFIHDLVVYYLYPEIEFNEGFSPQNRRDYFVSNFLKEYNFINMQIVE